MKTKIDLSNVDYGSLVVDDIHMEDYPDFCDAYFSEGCYLDGTPLPDDVLEELNEDGELIHLHVFETLH